MDIERRLTNTSRGNRTPTPAIERQTKSGKTLIVGYGATFYVPGDPGTQYELMPDMYERIMPGAFDDALKRSDPAALFNHDKSLIVGRLSSGTLRLTVDRVGLRYEIQPPNTTLGHDLVEILRRRDVTGSSFAFNIGRAGRVKWVQEGVKDIRLIESFGELFDVGPVVYPAYSATTSGVTTTAGDRTRGRRATSVVRAKIQQYQCHARLLEIGLAR